VILHQESIFLPSGITPLQVLELIRQTIANTRRQREAGDASDFTPLYELQRGNREEAVGDHMVRVDNMLGDSFPAQAADQRHGRQGKPLFHIAGSSSSSSRGITLQFNETSFEPDMFCIVPGQEPDIPFSLVKIQRVVAEDDDPYIVFNIYKVRRDDNSVPNVFGRWKEQFQNEAKRKRAVGTQTCDTSQLQGVVGDIRCAEVLCWPVQVTYVQEHTRDARERTKKQAFIPFEAYDFLMLAHQMDLTGRVCSTRGREWQEHWAKLSA